MTLDRSWLPPLIQLEDFGGDWSAYLNAVLGVFDRDFGGSRPDFRGKRMGLKRHPLVDGMPATFWHMISEGKGEDQRTPDMRRCERIGWPRAMLLAAEDENRVLVWEEPDPRRGLKYLLTLPDFSYLFVIDDRGDYVLPWTAYSVEHEHGRRKLRVRFEQARHRRKS